MAVLLRDHLVHVQSTGDRRAARSPLTDAFPSGRCERGSFKFGFPVSIVRPQWPWEITKEESHHLS